MKKLLLLINLFSCLLFTASCQNSKKTKGEVATETKPIITETAVAVDTTKSATQTTSAAGTAGTNKGTVKDSTITTGHAVIHPTPPNQEKIDSLKKVKVKKPN
jgi:hypothetical protein